MAVSAGQYVELCCITLRMTCQNKPKDPPPEAPPCDPSKQSDPSPPFPESLIPEIEEPKPKKKLTCGSV